MIHTQLTGDDELLIRRYLLGEIAEEDSRVIEQWLLTDRQYFNQVLRIEEELIDEYMHGKLNSRERKRFEVHFMNAPERRESVEFAKALNRYISTETIREPDGERVAGPGLLIALRSRRRAAIEAFLICVVLLLAAGSIWLLIETTRLGRQVEQLRAERAESGLREDSLRQQLDEQRARGEQLARQLEQQQDKLAQVERELSELEQPRFGSTVSLALVAGMSRTPAQADIAILRPDTERLRLKLEIDEGSYSSYRVEVQTAEGETIWSRDALKAQRSRDGKAVVIVLPAAKMTRSYYLIMLSGKTLDGAYEEAGTYNFKVARR